MKFPRVRPWRVYTSSHPSRGAWIEIFGWGCCRRCLWSHPSRGAWIEITLLGCGSSMVVWSHPSRGAWIEIFLEVISWHYMASRTPHGVRGLKYTDTFPTIVRQRSHPSRGAWIEIYTGAGTSCRHPSHPSRGAWIEIQAHHMQAALRQSHPSRGAWIEIHPNFGNHRTLRGRTPHGVRGLKCPLYRRSAWRCTSHPSRGAWIEISLRTYLWSIWNVSHPSRGAWIEIGRR